MVCSLLMITTACTSDPTDDSLRTKTEDSTELRDEAGQDEAGSAGGSQSAAEPGDTDTAADTEADQPADDADQAADDQSRDTNTQAEGPGDPKEANEDLGEAVGAVIAETDDDLTGAALEAHIAERFAAFWLAFDIARTAPSATPETDYPALFELAAGEQLERANADLKELHRSGQAIREPETPAIADLTADSALRIRVDSVDAGVAELTSCLVNDQVRYEVGSGAAVGGGVITVMTKSTMAKADGAWKLIRSEPVALDQGVSGCWLDPDGDFDH